LGKTERLKIKRTDAKRKKAEILKKKVERMTSRNNQKVCLIYPENRFKSWWDLFMTLVLLITCIATPYTIAFVIDEPPSLIIFNAVIDALFLMDMILCFLSVYYDDEMKLIDDRKKITKNYL